MYQWTTTGGSVVSSTGQYTNTFIGASGLSSGTYIVKRHEVRKIVNFPQEFYELEGVWGRGVFTNGWNLRSPNLGEGFCEIVPGSESTTGATLRTYVYQVWSVMGSYLGYYPTSPSNVQFAYTALGTDAPEISGTKTVCTSNSTFTLHNRPPSTTVTWTRSNNLTYVSGQGTNNYTVKASNSSTSGQGWVQANINGATFRKTLWVGKPNFILEGDRTIGIREPGVASLEYNDFQEITNVDWTRSGSIATVTGGLIVAHFRAGSQAGYGSVYANATNCCGSKEAMLLVEVTGGWYSVYPNPATDQLNIDILLDKLSEELKPKPVEILLFDKSMSIRKQIKSKGSQFTLNISDLKPDVYYLQIKIGDKTNSEKIIITRD